MTDPNAADDDALVERVARAICDIIGVAEYDALDATDDFNRDDFRKMAKAALSATPLARYREALEFAKKAMDAGEIPSAYAAITKALEGE